MAELNAAPEKAGRRSGRNRIQTRVDLTAMVDLAFLLITFFMLTTTLQKNNAMQVAMPDKTDHPIDEPGVPESRTMTVCLGSHDKAVWFMGMPESPITKPEVVDYSKNGLRKALLQKRKEIMANTGKDLIVLVKPSDHSAYGNLVSALDEMSITKIDRYAIADIGKSDIDLLKRQHVY